MTGEKFQPGEPLDSISARNWNALQDALNDYQSRRELRDERGPNPDYYPTDTIKARNNSCADRARGEVLEVCDNLVFQPRHLWFTAAIPKGPNGCYGVLTRPIPENGIDQLQVSGVVRAWVNITNTRHTRCDVVEASTYFTSNETGTTRILWQPGTTGLHLCAVVLSGPCSSATTTINPLLTTTTWQPVPRMQCDGTCEWLWEETGNYWRISSDGCAAATTTTSTTAAPDLRNCFCEAATTTTASPTTTGSPTTTTTADCNCLYPPFCGVVDQEKTITWCAKEINVPPSCGTPSTTTVSPTTTTTCDCSGTTTTTTDAPDDCSGSCNWQWLPNNLGGLGWVNILNGCPASCPCPSPTVDGGDHCTPQSTNCVAPPPPPPTPAPWCTGYCEYWWLPDSSEWKLTTWQCESGGIIDCTCQPPSVPGNNCGPERTPCGSPPTTIDPCANVCYPTTTTTTGQPTTTTGDCHQCKWEWEHTSSEWIMVQDLCRTGCNCAYPAIDGGAACETRWIPCQPTTTSTSTTTAAPTTSTGGPTTTTGSPTTTTTCTPGSGERFWKCVDSPPGCCTGVTTAGPGCFPYWELQEPDNCCGEPDPCLAPASPCDCAHLGEMITCPCGSTECTTTTTTTTCAPCAAMTCADDDCCIQYRCNIVTRTWEVEDTGVYCDTPPSAAVCMGADPSTYNSCLDGTLTCAGDARCVNCDCGPCATTTTTTTAGPTTTTTCDPNACGHCAWLWQQWPAPGRWVKVTDNCSCGQDGSLCRRPRGTGSHANQMQLTDCCGNSGLGVTEGTSTLPPP